MANFDTAEAVISRIQSGMRVFVHGASATPTPLLEALAARTDLEDVTVYSLHLSGAGAAALAAAPQLRSVSLFTGPAMRAPIADGRADYIPVFLSDVPRLFTSGAIRLDAAMVQLSHPDGHGHCTLGVSVDAALAATQSAGMVLAEINARMPRTCGHNVVPLARLSAYTTSDRALVPHPMPVIDDIAREIAAHIAPLVDDGATLQIGVGAIPEATLALLGNKVGLGVHTEMFSDGLIPLIEQGVITNEHKAVHRGRTVAAFVTGTQPLFDFVHENHAVELHPADRTNDTATIRENPRVTAINSAIEIDLTGQVCADSIGHRIYSGIGGQMDFVRGAALSTGGKAIIALPSMAAHGTVSRIVHELNPGAGVVTTRGHVQWIVTEYGAVNLHGKTLRERAALLIEIAHPDVRGELRRAVRAVRHFV
jgi:acyl-CoA hydrolase